jgi:hypothetical protein
LPCASRMTRSIRRLACWAWERSTLLPRSAVASRGLRPSLIPVRREVPPLRAALFAAWPRLDATRSLHTRTLVAPTPRCRPRQHVRTGIIAPLE